MDKMAKYSVSEKELTVDEVGLVTNCLLLIRWDFNDDDIFTRICFFKNSLTLDCTKSK